MSRRTYALVAAAGQGTRLGADLPKAYVPLRGRTLLGRSVQIMVDSGAVDEVLVLVSPVMEDYAREIIAREVTLGDVAIRCVHGGSERADSVWAGLQAIASDAVVLIHDAARALTPPGMVARVAQRVHAGAPAVIPVLPVADTIKTVVADAATGAELVTGTPDRSILRAVQTPQGFDLATLRAANEAYFSENPDFVATDDASLMEWRGVPVTAVLGDAMAFKITTPIDLTLANAVLES
ncbi:2-C-methyl-D-erythritol 4-phosphate cytidylyltransferase [uncultured Corynebacterium sp.]|uniref:2-C-methyl-D-erythritol 4-phosphate cytidylyltransferase n=1 Tax=uncultured Corynebacterium sp. TaxID=159447 RepID=UPI0025F77116|nr:2-C-methyl-D-erythritol 4-phosphate cytidylyltransferase [uncultured Corynebacterium sp.]